MKNLKTIATAFLLLFAFTSVFAQKNDLQETNLKGNIKWVKEYTYTKIDSTIINGEIKKDNFTDCEWTFYNKEGNIEKIIEYLPPQEADGKPTIKSIDSIVYHKNGNEMIMELYYFEGNINVMMKSIYLYDVNGNLVQEEDYDTNNNISKKWVYTYDAKGNKTEEIEYDKDNNLSIKSIYSYDVKGNMTEQKQYNKFDVLYDYWYTEYDNQGYVTSTENSFINRSGKISIISKVYKNDSNGNHLEIIETIQGKNAADSTITNTTKNVYEYNKMNDPISQKMYINSREPIEYYFKHDYDDYGNCTKTIYYFSRSYDNPFRIEIREISYY